MPLMRPTVSYYIIIWWAIHKFFFFLYFIVIAVVCGACEWTFYKSSDSEYNVNYSKYSFDVWDFIYIYVYDAWGRLYTKGLKNAITKKTLHLGYTTPPL